MSKKPRTQGMFPERYWERPVPQKRGDSNDSETFCAVGSALTAWETAEEAMSLLAHVFSQATDAPHGAVVQRLFGSIESSSGRRNALEKLSVLYFHPYQDDPVVKTPFCQLMAAFSSASKLRDDIAHGKVQRVSVKKDGGEYEDSGAFLYPSEYNSERNYPFGSNPEETELPFSIMSARYRYTGAQLNLIEHKFRVLRNKTWDYIRSIQKVDGLIPAIKQKSIAGSKKDA